MSNKYKRRKNHCLEVLIDELKSRKIEYEVHPTRKHIHIHFGPELKHKTYIATTGSDQRSWLNARAILRRIIKEHSLGEP